MILFIDNYDSFTFNLVQYFGELGQEIEVYRNDEITILDIENKKPKYIVISPGPCTPNDAGISLDLVKKFSGIIPILGVCLGHQTIAQAFGAKIVRAKRLMHGKTSLIYHDRKSIFTDIPEPFRATRYHSLIIDPNSMPEHLEITASTDEGEIMGIRHKELAVEGIQFHPEAILTEHGKKLLNNFLKHYMEQKHEVDV